MRTTKKDFNTLSLQNYIFRFCFIVLRLVNNNKNGLNIEKILQVPRIPGILNFQTTKTTKQQYLVVLVLRSTEETLGISKCLTT